MLNRIIRYFLENRVVTLLLLELYIVIENDVYEGHPEHGGTTDRLHSRDT